MKHTTPFSLPALAGMAGLLILIGPGCGTSAPADGGGAGGASIAGGNSGNGGAVVTGGVVGMGGNSSATSAGGGGGSGAGGGGGGGGGLGGSTAVGSGGTGTGGAASVGDAAIRDAGRDARNGAEANGSRDAPVDAPAAQRDAGISTGGDGGCVPNYACTPVSPNTGDPYADCVARVNQFRACVCLPPLAQWTAGQACADQDAQYDSQQNTAHAGANANICDWGNGQDECPDWTRSTPESVIDGCLLMMFQEGPPPAGSCTGSCFSAHGHYINMTGTGYKSGIACGFYTTASGSIWATQNFK